MKPRDSYASVNKSNVRAMLHDEFVERGCRTILFLPSSQRYELDSLLAHGFDLKDLHAVEMVPQVQANFTRRLSLSEQRELNQHRGKLSQIGGLLPAGRVDAANLDFCCRASVAIPEISEFVASGCLNPRGALVAVQVWARGQERIERGLDIEKAFRVSSEIEVAPVWAPSRYWNESSRCVMAYYLYQISRKTKP